MAPLVVLATRIYLLGLMGHTLLEVSARSFYARQDARTPLFAAALNSALYILLAFNLAPRFGVGGIALANGLAFTGEALLLLFLLNRKVPGVLQVGRYAAARAFSFCGRCGVDLRVVVITAAGFSPGCGSVGSWMPRGHSLYLAGDQVAAKNVRLC